MADPLWVYYIGEDPYLSNIAPLRFRTHPSKWKNVYVQFNSISVIATFSSCQTLIHLMNSYHGAYQLNMAFGLVHMSLADEIKFTKTGNFTEIFSGFLKTAVCKKINSSTHEVVSKLNSKCWVLQSTLKKERKEKKLTRWDKEQGMGVISCFVLNIFFYTRKARCLFYSYFLKIIMELF